MSRLLLLSSSRDPESGYLGALDDALPGLLGPEPRRLAFVPYAAVGFSYEEYLDRIRSRFAAFGHTVASVHVGEPRAALASAQAVVVGGGNTFRLLERLHATGLLHELRQRVIEGVPYIGWSAGANLACPTIGTTNDMPVVRPPSFSALAVVPFQINPHYTERTIPDHHGESRDERIAEFLALNPGVRVVGLREGSWLRRVDGALELGGRLPLRLFAAGKPPRDLPPGCDLRFLLE
jgi:dipeptidase E